VNNEDTLQCEKIKNDLFIEFSGLGGNYKKLGDTKSLKKKIQKLFKEMGKTDPQLLDVLRILDVYIEEALNDEDFEKFFITVVPIVDRLEYTDIINWDINDIRIMQAAINYVKDFEKVDKLEKKTIAAIEKHINDRPVHMIEFFVYLNVQVRYLKATYLEEDITQESLASKKLKKRFKDCCDCLLKIYENNKEELKAWKYVILTRIAVFHRNSNEAIKNLELLKEVGDKPLYEIIRKEVIKYSPHFGSSITDQQFSIMVGGRIREFRKAAGLSVEEFAMKLHFSKNYISLVERGERNFTTRTLARVCEEFNITLDELIFGEGNKI